MYQILIADDEVRDRRIVKILLERRYPGQFTFLEAENGARALEILHKQAVQLLLLDLNMPGVSGIEVLHNLKRVPYVIVLTAYSNFEYTREALRCGVRDYLLKPPLREEFYRSVDQFLADCERMQESLTPQIQSREVFTRDLARQLMYFGDAKKIRGLLDVLDISENSAQCAVLSYEPDTMQDGSCVLDETEELLDRWNAKYAADLYDGGLAVFLFCGEDVAATQDLFARLTHYLKNNLCTRVQIRLGTASKVFGDYPKAFLDLAKLEEAEKVNSRAFIRENDLENAVRQKNFSAAMKALQPALESLEKRENEDFTKCQLLMALNQCSRQLLIGQTAGDAPYQVSKLISASGRKQITEITARYLEWLIENYAPPERLNNAVQAVLNLVRADCSQPWSIDSIADRLHVNGGYLSHLFKEHTGRCFTDYLAEQRINLAVDLMQTTDLSLAQIGEKVGYGDPNYFSRVFKKRKGVGPREYSRSLEVAQK